MKKLLELFFKNLFADEFVCLNCKDERIGNPHHYLCDKCFEKIEFIKNPCIICGDEVSSFEKYCDSCKNAKSPHKFDKAFCVAKYNSVPKMLVYALKYNRNRSVTKVIVPFMLEEFVKRNLKDLDLDIIIPVPIGKERLKHRGFNQAELLAKEIAKSVNIPMESGDVVRIVETQTQTTMTKYQRFLNVKNAFEVVDFKKIKGKNILIVDDIITTGATMSEIAKILKKKGANKVYGLAFCHT